MSAPTFLTVEQLLALHETSIRTFGGELGLRDRGLLESAVAVPQAAFGGEYLHASIDDMAAAYLYHIALNHPFVDGNKRAALLAALVFLDLNGYALEAPHGEIYDLTVSVASGSLEKDKVVGFFRYKAAEL